MWNIALDRYESIELGEARTDFAKVIEDSKEDTSDLLDRVDWLEQAQKEASDIIKNPGKGHVVIYPSIADPQELLIMDTTDVNTARKVWRWNVGGLGFSSTGYNGTYGLAMTNNGAIVADRMTTGTLRAINIIGVAITGSSITSESGSYKMLLNNGSLNNYVSGVLRSSLNPYSFSLKDSKAVETMSLTSSGVSINKEGTTTQLGYLGRGRDASTNREEMTMNVEAGNIGGIAVKDTSGGLYIRRIAASSAGAHISKLTMGGSYVGGSGEIVNSYLKNTGVSSAFTVYNNVPLDFYTNLNMHGYSIINQSDIRLKENIENTTIDGIEETQKLNFVEFNRKQNYQTRNKQKQPSAKRELGLIAQYSPFLCAQDTEDHYLGLDMNKQIMLNSLTNKQLIERIEHLEGKVNRKNRNKRKYHRGVI